MTPKARRARIMERLLILCMQDDNQTTPEDDALMDELRAKACDSAEVAAARAEREEVDADLRSLGALAVLIHDELRRFGVSVRVDIGAIEDGISDDVRESGVWREPPGYEKPRPRDRKKKR